MARSRGQRRRLPPTGRSAAHQARDRAVAWPLGPLATVGGDELGRRAFLHGTVAVPALLGALSPTALWAAALAMWQAPRGGESFADGAFWDDGTGWV